MEKNSNQDKKKIIITLVVGTVTLLVLIISSTYAYFQVSTANNNTNSNVTVNTGKPGTVTLKQGVSDLHIVLNSVDMSKAKKGSEYYADDTENYVEEFMDGLHTISSVEITDGDEDLKYKCSVKITVTMDTETNSMGSVIEKDDFELNVGYNTIDLSELRENKTKTFTTNFKMYGNSTYNLEGYVKLLNKETNQNYLANKTLNVNIKTSDIECNVYEESELVEYLRSKDENKSLSSTIQGDMYRYQGTDNVANWICFGTTDNCGANEELIDKYMYRIIGITDDGEMKLIKETFIKEGETAGFAWNDKYYITGDFDYTCENGECPEWPDSLLFKRLNGISNGTIKGDGKLENKGNTDIFVDSNEYDYLRSGDNKNGENTSSKWYNLIANHNWIYGEINEGDSNLNESVIASYNGDAMYAVESGHVSTFHYVKPIFSGFQRKEEYKWLKKEPAKIGLMYFHDYYYSYYDGTDEATRGNGKNGQNLKNSWLHFRKDNYNIDNTREWVIDSGGIGCVDCNFSGADHILSDGNWNGSSYFYSWGVRPVFYLSSEAKIKDGGEGTKTNPFILDVE